MVGVNVTIKNAKIRREKTQGEIDNFLKDNKVREIIASKEKASYEKGYNQRTNEVLSVISACEDVINKIKDLKFEIIHEYEPHVVNLALKAFEKVMARELISGSAKMHSIIKPVLDDIPGVTKAIIKLNPEDFTGLINLKDEIVSGYNEAFVEVVADNDIDKGGCIIDTDMGTVDATINTRIEQVVAAIKGE